MSVLEVIVIEYDRLFDVPCQIRGKEKIIIFCFVACHCLPSKLNGLVSPTS